MLKWDLMPFDERPQWSKNHISMKNFKIQGVCYAFMLMLYSMSMSAQSSADIVAMGQCLCSQSERALDTLVIESSSPDRWGLSEYSPFSSPDSLIYYNAVGSGAYLTWITPALDSLIALNPEGPTPYRFLYRGYRDPSIPFDVTFTNGMETIVVNFEACVPDDGSIVGPDTLCLGDEGAYAINIDPAVLSTINWTLSGTTAGGEMFSGLVLPGTGSGTIFMQMTGSGSITGAYAGSGSSLLFNSAGNFTLHVTGETNKGCSFSDSINIYVQNTDYNIIGFNEVCPTDSVPYSIPLDAAFDSVVWTLSGGGVFQNGETTISNTNNVWVKWGGTPDTYEINVRAICNSSAMCMVTDQFEVTVQNNIDAQISGDTIVCLNGTYTYNTNVHGLSSLTWSSRRGNSLMPVGAIPASVNVTFTQTGLDTLFATGMTSMGCTVHDSIIIDVKGTGIMIMGSTMICKDVLGEYSAFYEDGSIAEFTALTWSVLGDDTLADTTTIGMDTLMVVWNRGGNHQVVVTGTTSIGCTLRDTFTVNVIDNEFIILGDTVACMGYEAQFFFVQATDSMDVLNGPVVTWSIYIGSPDKAVPLLEVLTDTDNNDTLTHRFQQGTFGSNQPYYVVATSMSHGCVLSDTIIVHVIGDGQMVINGPDSLCAGGDAWFSLGIPKSVLTAPVTWSVFQKSNNAPVIPSNIHQVSNDSIRVTFPNVADTFIVRAMGMVSGQCNFTIETEIVLTDNAFIINLPELDTTCLSTDSVSYVLSVDTTLINAATFSWTITDLSNGQFLIPTLTNSGSRLAATYRYPRAGRYRHEVRGEYGTDLCDINEIFTVTVKDTAYHIVGDQQICIGDTTVYTIRQSWNNMRLSDIDADGLNWMISDPSAGTIVQPVSGDTVYVVWHQQGIYTLSVEGMRTCGCPIAADSRILVRDGGFIIGGPNNVCRGETVGFTILNFDTSYVDDLIMDSTVWSVSHGTILNGQRTDSLTVRFNTYLGRDPIFVDTIRFRGVTDDGCQVDTQILVSIRNNQYFLDGPLNVCQGDSVNISLRNLLDSSLVSDVSTLDWVISPGDTLTTGVTLNQKIDTAGVLSYTWDTPGLFTVTAFGYTADSCAVFASYTLSVNMTPDINIMGDLNTCINTTDNYWVNLNMNDIDSISWSVRPYAGTLDSARILSGQGTREIIVDWRSTGDYYISVIGVTNGGCVFTDTINTKIVNTANAGQMTCNSDLNITVDSECRVNITHDMLLENPDPNIPNEQYEIEIIDDATGQVLSNGFVDVSWLNRKLRYVITHECSRQSCWGYLTLEDKTIPELICGRDTLNCNSNIFPTALNFGPHRRQGFPVPPNATVNSIGGNNSGMFSVAGFEKCGTATLTFRDSTISDICTGIFGAVIYRHWTMTNVSGLQSRCTDTIYIRRLTIDDLDLTNLRNYIGSDGFECGIPYPTPSRTGNLNILSGQFCFNIDATYSDMRTNFCGEQSYRVVRTWTILDWCTGDVKIHTQTIDVLDREGPQINLTSGDITIQAGNHSCTGVVDLSSGISITDRCSDVVYRRVRIFEKDRTGKLLYNITDGVYTGLVFDESVTQILIAVDARDACDRTNEREITRMLRIVDNVKPIPICDENTVITIGANGWAIATTKAFDDKSWDNCGVARICVAKVSDLDIFDSLDTNNDKLVSYSSFNSALNCPGAYDDVIITISGQQMIHRDSLCRDYIKFCCNDAMTGRVMVALTVFDHAGNSNTCMVNARIQDNSAITKLVRPQGMDLTVSCVEDIRPFLTNDGSAVTFLTSLCGIPIPPDSFTARVDTNRCGVGTIIRNWSARDGFGNSVTHAQTITIGFPGEIFNPSNVANLWPQDYEGAGCPGSSVRPENLPSQFRVNLPTNFTCSSLAVDYEDLVFRNTEGFCAKILRTWTLIDWCQTRSNDPNAGVYKHVQVLKLIDDQRPTIILGCESETFEASNNTACSAFVSLRASATDCHDEADLRWTFEVYDFDSTKVLTGKSDRINTNLGIGVYRVRWIVEDPCGNSSECNKRVEVVDTRGPSIVCRDLERTIGANGTVTLNPQDFISSATDNCSSESGFTYRFNAVNGQTSLVFECVMLEGLPSKEFDLTVFVLDLLGNATSCNVKLRVLGGTVCQAGNFTTQIGGGIFTESDFAVDNVSVSVAETGASALQSAMTPLQGTYAFNNLAMYKSYEIKATRNGDYMNGVSTLDIILIQRHILGLRQLDSPYKIIAADVDGSGTVSASDLIHIRRLLLGITAEFPIGRSWTFVDESQEFSNPASPFPYIQTVKVDNLDRRMDNANMIAVKMGDVNDNVQLLSSALGKARSISRLVSALEHSDESSALLTIRPRDISSSIIGLQMALKYDPRKLVVSKVTALGVILENDQVRIDNENGIVRLIWNEREGVRLEEGQSLFTLAVENISGDVLDAGMFTIEESALRAEIYHTADREIETSDIVLTQEVLSTQGLVVKQNTPNPFRESTLVEFFVPARGLVNITIHDLTGKLISDYKTTYDKGWHQYNIEAAKMSGTGMYIYQIQTGQELQSKKMIIVE